MSSKEMFCSPEIERLFISSILNYPDAYYSFSDIVNKNDFGKKIHQTCWIVISDILNKGEKLDYRLVALRLTELKIDFKNELPHNLTIADYLEGISFIKINKDLIEQYAVELKKLSGKKFLAEAALETYTALTEAKNDLSYSEIVQLADKTFNDKVNIFENNLEEDEPVDLYSGLESLIEEQGEKQEDAGIFCPFKILQKKFGDFYEGDLYIWASRAKSGKSLYLMNMLHSCCNNLGQNVKGLYIDTELETIRVQWRLMSMLTGINEYYFRTGKWRNNLHYVKAVRECWPMVKNFFGSVEHIYIGNRNVEEVCSIIRRWYKKNISIDPSLKGIIVYDYIKLATELMSNDYGKMKDYQMAGHKCDSLKKLASELKCPILTSVQTNRQNASKKMADRIDDANAIGLSDQIVQYCSNMYLFNRVLLEERQELQARYGLEKVTHRLVPVATRNQGEEAPGFDGDLIKIVNDDGSVKYLEDVIYYNVDNFRVEEVGNLFSLEKNREKYKLEDNQSENVELF